MLCTSQQQLMILNCVKQAERACSKLMWSDTPMTACIGLTQRCMSDGRNIS